MWRKIDDSLERWYSGPRCKALLLKGAWQVGKTHSIRKFAHSHYDEIIELNFNTTPQAKDIFSTSLEADFLIGSLEDFTGRSCKSGRTLIFLDDIHQCLKALTALKSLVADGRFDYIACDALTGVKYSRRAPYPMGSIDPLTLYPLDFEEFCVALGTERSTFDYLRGCYERRESVTQSVHQQMLELFWQYLVVGGMPAVVERYADTHDLSEVIALQKDILKLYRKGIRGHADPKPYTRMLDILEHLPAHIQGTTKRYQLPSFGTNYQERALEARFVWLRDSRLALACYSLAAPVKPLINGEETRLFKLYLNDVGLLSTMYLTGKQQALIVKGDFVTEQTGLINNAIACELKAHGFELRYLHQKNFSDIEFVVEGGGRVLALAVRTGRDYRRHRALDHALAEPLWDLEGLVFCPGNCERAEEITYLPWYMVMFLTPQSLEPPPPVSQPVTSAPSSRRVSDPAVGRSPDRGR